MKRNIEEIEKFINHYCLTTFYYDGVIYSDVMGLMSLTEEEFNSISENIRARLLVVPRHINPHANNGNMNMNIVTTNPTVNNFSSNGTAETIYGLKDMIVKKLYDTTKNIIVFLAREEVNINNELEMNKVVIDSYIYRLVVNYKIHSKYEKEVKKMADLENMKVVDFVNSYLNKFNRNKIDEELITNLVILKFEIENYIVREKNIDELKKLNNEIVNLNLIRLTNDKEKKEMIKLINDFIKKLEE